MKWRGKEMDFEFGFFLAGVVCFFGMFYFYNKKEDGKYARALTRVEELNKTIKTLEGLINSNIQTVALCNSRVSGVEASIIAVKKECEGNAFDIDALGARSEKLKEAQIELQDKLSKKRPVIQLSQPVSVDVVNGGGIKSLIKNSGKKAKELEK